MAPTKSVLLPNLMHDYKVEMMCRQFLFINLSQLNLTMRKMEFDNGVGRTANKLRKREGVSAEAKSIVAWWKHYFKKESTALPFCQVRMPVMMVRIVRN